MKKRNKIIPVFLVIAFFLSNTYLSVYATEETTDYSELSAATPSEAVKNETLVSESLSTFTVAFDPDDGTAYEDFFKVTVPDGSHITTKPSVPKRDGYIFKGWYGFLDDNDKPVFWNFNSDIVEDNTTLWAFWEKACLVAFDPDDGISTYEEFFKATVPTGSLVSPTPNTPKRDGYIFKGWYGYLDSNYEPVFWNFNSDTVEENTTLWAHWEEACVVAFDPDDGITGYEDFFKAVVPTGGLVTSSPNAPKREGYTFNGWYSYLDDMDKPVFWHFDTDTVHHNITLWAAWEKDTETSGEGNENETGNGNGNENGNGSTNGNENENKTPQKGSGGGSSSSSKKKGDPSPAETPTSEETLPVLEEPTYVISEATPAPKGNMISSNKLDSMPKTGNLDILRYGINMSLSLLLLPVLLFHRKEEQ